MQTYSYFNSSIRKAVDVTSNKETCLFSPKTVLPWLLTLWINFSMFSSYITVSISVCPHLHVAYLTLCLWDWYMLLSTVGSLVLLVGILLCGYKTFYLTTPILLLTDIWVVFNFGPRWKIYCVHFYMLFGKAFGYIFLTYLPRGEITGFSICVQAALVDGSNCLPGWVCWLTLPPAIQENFHANTLLHCQF